MSTLDDEIYTPSTIILGVFGNRKISESELHEKVLNLILQELERLPDRILIPVEGISSIYIQDWADSLKVSTHAFQTDWVRNGKVAQILRDDRIQRECTHALVFLSPKSDKLEKMAERMAKKGKTVFTSSCHSHELEQLVFEPQPKALERAHKSNIGKGQMLLKFQKKGEC
jgi:putative NADH-flavin reductase